MDSFYDDYFKTEKNLHEAIAQIVACETTYGRIKLASAALKHLDKMDDLVNAIVVWQEEDQ